MESVNGYNVVAYEKSNIYVIENVFDNTFCRDIIKLIETLPLFKDLHSRIQNVECFIAYTTQLLKEDDSLYYSFLDKTNMYTNRLNGITHDELQTHVNNINEKMKMVADIMKQVNHRVLLNYNTGYNLRKIYGCTQTHSDGLAAIQTSDVNFINGNIIDKYKMVRNASIIISLNDDYDGGIFNFPLHDISFKMKKGSVVIFPPYWTHPHEVSTVENGTFRYTINTWSCEQIT